MTYKVVLVGSDNALSLEADSPDAAAKMYGERIPLPASGFLLVEGGQPHSYHQYKIDQDTLTLLPSGKADPAPAIEKPCCATPAADADSFIIGCPACHKALSVPTARLEGRHQCPQCQHEFDAPSKDIIEQRRKYAPPHHWIVIKEDGQSKEVQGLDAIAEAMSNGTISPSDSAASAPFLPAVSVRTLAGARRALKKLYDPLTVFADFWSWALVALIPAGCLSLIGLFAEHGHPAIGLLWFAAIIAILLAAGAFMLITLILAIPVVGLLIAGVILILTVGSALGGYLVLALVGGGGMWVLNLLHKAMYPLATMMGRMLKIEQQRLANWQQWMEPVDGSPAASAAGQLHADGTTAAPEAPASPDGPQKQVVDGHDCIVFPCTECGARVTARSKYSGMVQRCPECNERLIVPDVF